MEMHQVRYFLAVCEALNFTRAAKACHVAQPSLTAAIKKLEQELGGELFRRERSRTHLTDRPAMAGLAATAAVLSARTAPRAVRDLLRYARRVVDIGLNLSSRSVDATDVRPSPKLEMPMTYGFDSEKL